MNKKDVIKKLEIEDEIIFSNYSQEDVRAKVVNKGKFSSYIFVEREDGRKGGGPEGTWALEKNGGNWKNLFRTNPNNDITIKI